MTKRTQGTKTTEAEVKQGEVVATAVTDAEVVQEATALARQPAHGESILSIIKDAVISKADVQTLRELLAIRREERADQAREAFEVAMVAFSAKVPTIIKTRVVDFTTQKGRTHYTHAGLPETVEQIQGLMAECQLSRRWKDEDPKKVGNIRIRCIASHIMGHSESFAAEAPPDTSGNKNDAQAVASIITYLRRTTLFAVLGLVAKDDVDDDGAGGKKTEPERPKSGELLDADENEAKKEFAQECHILIGGRTQLTPSELRDLLTQARMLGQQAKVAECVRWLKGKRIVKGTDGRWLIEAPQEEQPTADAEADPLDAAASGDTQYECETCLARYKVLPSGGHCTATDGKGKTCPGKVVRGME